MTVYCQALRGITVSCH